MFRNEMPRVYELRDLIVDPSNPAAYFQNFDASLQDNLPLKKQFWLAFENKFARLDHDAWESLKSEAFQYLTKYALKGRAWEQLISILNQALAYNYLIDIGCSGVHFIARVKKQKTPDLSAQLAGQKVLCEVKTINRSEQKLAIRLAGEADTTRALLDDDFFKKLDSDIATANCQMLTYDKDPAIKRVVFIHITFDDSNGEYDSNYYAQIDQHLAASANEGLDIVFYNQITAFHPHIRMQHAQVINE